MEDIILLLFALLLSQPHSARVVEVKRPAAKVEPAADLGLAGTLARFVRSDYYYFPHFLSPENGTNSYS